ncbi:MAG TPA: DNA translocase FtsK 4TM domain-containing protein, partial [Pirellulales bacterium]|nr:DNA translocase FtsK 4TM domain-containing protein [Pirellulales bacterium]
MPSARNRKHDLIALVLLAATAFLGLALVTYDPADPPSSLVYPPRAHIENVCGRAGAMAAFLLYEGVGLPAWYVVASIGALGVTLLRGRQITDGKLRCVGWLLSLMGLTALVSMAMPGASAGPVIGSGGYVGATGRGLLHMNVATTGAYLLSTSVLIAGLLLCTDYWIVQGVGRILGTTVRLRPARKAAEVAAKPVAAEGPAIRMNGKPLNKVAMEEATIDEETLDDEEEAEDDADAAEEDASEEEETEEKAAPAVAAAPAPVVTKFSEVRIKKNGAGARDERKEVMSALDAAANRTDEATDYQLPPLEMLLPNEQMHYEEQEKEVRRKAKILEKTFASFGFNVKVVEIETGPVIAQFEVELESGLRLAKITNLADDLAIALRVPSVRIVAPIPGKNTVGIEVPNEERQLVRLREVIEEANGKAAKMKIPIYLGKDVAGNPMVADLASLPHLLIAGRTGTGKSVCLNTILMSMLMMRRPDEVRMLLIDPKMVELSPYKTLPHLMHPVVTDMKKAEALLAWAVEKMEERYALLARAGVRHISGYNQLGEEELMTRLQPETDD